MLVTEFIFVPIEKYSYQFFGAVWNQQWEFYSHIWSIIKADVKNTVLINVFNSFILELKVHILAKAIL